MKSWEWEHALTTLAGVFLLIAPVAVWWDPSPRVAQQFPRDVVSAAVIGGSMIAGGLCIVAASIIRIGRKDKGDD